MCTQSSVSKLFTNNLNIRNTSLGTDEYREVVKSVTMKYTVVIMSSARCLCVWACVFKILSSFLLVYFIATLSKILH